MRSGEKQMIRHCTDADHIEILSIVNEAANAYRGVIPADRWHEPYMTATELAAEVSAGVDFWGWDDGTSLAGVMGIQPGQDVTLIRHAYVRAAMQRSGIGAALLHFLAKRATGPLLVGTWEAAAWAIAFYERNGFRRVSTADKDRLLTRYWNIPQRQKETSVVLVSADPAVMLSVQPPLKALHAIVSSKVAALEKLSTETLLASLIPGSPSCLKTRTDGTILDGHHRIHVLRIRNLDVDALPREVIVKED
jgi:GNAT superfamily N-acetyltransferase